MKPTILGAALALAVVPLSAQALDEDTRARCQAYHGLAETIMAGRQANVALVTQIETVDDDFIRQIIREAYKHPRFTTEAYQHHAIRDFANDVYAQCLDAYD